MDGNGHERTGRCERIGDIVSRLVAQIEVRECDGAGSAIPGAVECEECGGGVVAATVSAPYSAATGEETRSADGVSVARKSRPSR